MSLAQANAFVAPCAFFQIENEQALRLEQPLFNVLRQRQRAELGAARPVGFQAFIGHLLEAALDRREAIGHLLEFSRN